MRLYILIFCTVLLSSASRAEDSFNGQIEFSETSIAVGAPIAFKAEITLKGENYEKEIRTVKELLKKNDVINFRIFGIEKIAQNPNNADILEVAGGIVFLDTSKNESQVVSIGNGQSLMALKHASLQITETNTIERPEVFQILLKKDYLVYFIGIGFVLITPCYFFLKRRKQSKKNPSKQFGPKIQSKADVELLYSYLVTEVRSQEMPMSQRMKYNELIKNIDEVQYKKNITTEEFGSLEIRLLEIQKEENGNRI